MKGLVMVLLLGVASVFSSGCAVYMAVTQPPFVDITALEEGAGAMSRDMVVGRVGFPIKSTKNTDGSRTEYYEFYEGSEAGWKYFRTAFHAVADFFTFFLWELIGFPTELGIRGDKITARADFDVNDRLTSFTVLGREQKPLEKIHKEQNGKRAATSD
jgi:hypothetical protein